MPKRKIVEPTIQRRESERLKKKKEATVDLDTDEDKETQQVQRDKMKSVLRSPEQKERDRLRKQKSREKMNEVARELAKDKDKERRQLQRDETKSVPRSSEEKERNRLKMQKSREKMNEEARKLAKEKDKEKHQVQRDEMKSVLRSPEQKERDRLRKQKSREKMNEEARELAKDKDRERRQLQRDETKNVPRSPKEKERDRLKMQKSRDKMDEEARKLAKDKDKERHQVQRDEMKSVLRSPEQKERDRLRKQKSREKMNEVARELAKDKDKERRQLQRDETKNVPRSPKEKERDRLRMQKSRDKMDEEARKLAKAKSKEKMERLRTSSKAYLKLLDKYEKEIRQHATNVCCCCGGLWFPKSVKKFTRVSIVDRWKRKNLKFREQSDEESSDENDVESNTMGDEFLNRVLCVKADGAEFLLCNTCQRYILAKSPKVPKLCLSNGFDFPMIPQSVKELTPLEERLVALRIPFMQIRSIGTERQLKLKGNVVNVENDLEVCGEIFSIPRNLSDTSTVQLKLMRRITDRSPYMFETIRPVKVYNAAKDLIQQPLYENIVLSKHWMDLHQGETIRFVVDGNDELEHDDASPKDHDPIEDVGIETVDGAEESLFYNAGDIDIQAMMLAPGQGKVPIPLWKDTNAEELSFPTIYGGIPRTFKQGLKISNGDIAKSEIRRYDRRACTPTHLLYAFRKAFNEKLRNQIQIFLRKSVGDRKICARDARNTEYLKTIMQNDEGYAVLKELRASPAYFEHKHKFARAMVRQRGKCTFFITLSAAETKWGPLLQTLMQLINGKHITEEEAANLSFEEKAQLIRKDPVTCMREFDHRFRAVLNNLFKPDEGIFSPYKLGDYFTRLEFQMRGSPHMHGLFWIDDAPEYIEDDEDSIEKCVEFIDKFITCEKCEDGKMEQLIGLQVHKHKSTCSRADRKVQFCRFGFPKPPMEQTCILKPLDGFSDSEKAELVECWKLVQEDLVSRGTHPDTNPKFEDYLHEIGLTKEKYLLAVRSSIKRATVFLKREVNAIYINGYNRPLLEAWEANIDFQYVLDTYACARYCVGYVFKPEGGISKMLREASLNAKQGNLTIREKLGKFASILINGCEISGQEAAAYLLGIDYTHCSRDSIFVNTSLPDKRTRILLPKEALEKLQDNDDDVYAKGTIDHYTRRPEELEEMCLAEFATIFDYKTTKPKNMDKVNNRGEKIFFELQTVGYIKRRNVQKILRFVNFGKVVDQENYWREQLMLFVPWRDEEADLIGINHIRKGKRFFSIIERNSKPFYHNHDIDEELLKDYAADIADEEPDNEDQDEKDLRDQLFFEQTLFEGFDALEPPPRREPETKALKFNPPRVVDEKVYIEKMRSMNERQRRIVLNTLFNVKTGKPQHTLVHGGAGVGKSEVIHLIVQSLLRYYGTLPTTNPEEICVIVTAYTGKAAFNVFGMTLHSTFRLPPAQKPGHAEKLDESTANTLRKLLAGVKLFIIDEVSMLSVQHLFDINTRLQQIFSTKEDFGGKSFLVVGHFRQLPPIGGNLVFTPPTHLPLGEITGNYLWNKFKIYELFEIMRQKGAHDFCHALNGMSEAEMNKADEALIGGREIDKLPPEDQPPVTAIRLFQFNQQCDEYNASVHASLGTRSFTSIALDKVQGPGKLKQRNELLNLAKKFTRQQNSGLGYKVHLQVNGIYFISTNIDVSDGLFNGSTGVLKDFDLTPTLSAQKKSNIEIEEIRVVRAWMYFDNAFIGATRRNEDLIRAKSLLNSCHDSDQRFELEQIIHKLESQWTPIMMLKQKLTRNRWKHGLQLIRKQIPLQACNGMTIAKSQGCTLGCGVVVCVRRLARHRRITREELYVACSRPPTVELLWIDGEFEPPEPIPVDDPVSLELQRLRTSAQLEFSIRFLQDFDDSYARFYFHNVQSWIPHVGDIGVDRCPTSADVLAFVEPWLLPRDQVDLDGFRVAHRSNCTTSRNSEGALLLCKENCDVSRVQFFAHSPTNSVDGNKHCLFLSFHVFGFQVIVMYKSPNYPATEFVKLLKHQLSSCSGKVIFVGDVNINIREGENENFIRLFQQFQFHSLMNLTQPSTNGGTQIDICFSNVDYAEASYYESYYSYHKPICIT